MPVNDVIRESAVPSKTISNLTMKKVLLILFLISIAKADKQLKPNIVLIVTDDQDVFLHGMFPMRFVQRSIGEAGATFTNAFTTSALCCPSRASILSGMYAHNHRTYNNSLNGGCNGAYWRKNVEAKKSLPVFLQSSGYETFFAGKYLNQYRGAVVPPGWNDFHGLHGNSQYYNYTLRENGQNVSYTDTYLTDLISNLTTKFIAKFENGKDDQKPFFAMVCPPAPHQPFTPAVRHRSAFAGIKALRTPNFNVPPEVLEKHWLVATSKLMNSNLEQLIDSYFQQRWETLLAVDEMIETVFEQLKKINQLNNTYVIFTSDNGYHLGQFAQPYDKRQPYETDIRVPLLIRGPGILNGLTINEPVALLDLFPTILDWAKITQPMHTDGQSFNHHLESSSTSNGLTLKVLHRSLLIQHWGEGNEETFNDKCPEYRPIDNLAGCTIETNCHCQDTRNNTYACIRHFHADIDRLYCEFRDEENFVEAYDLVEDPYQMKNLGYELLPIERALYSLTLSNLTRCAGATCRNINI